MTRKFSKQRRSAERTSTKPISRRSRTKAKPVTSKAALPSVRFRKGQPRLPAKPYANTSLQLRVLTHKHKSLTLRQWSRRTKAGPPFVIWSRIKAGWPIEEALGGSAAVARAIAFVSVKDARDAERSKRHRKRRVRSRLTVSVTPKTPKH